MIKNIYIKIVQTKKNKFIIQIKQNKPFCILTLIPRIFKKFCDNGTTTGFATDIIIII